MRTASGFLVAVLLVSACSETEAPVAPDLSGASGELATGQRTSLLRTCNTPFRPAPAAGWRHWTSRFVSALGSPVHSANDVISRPGTTAGLQARFAYGGVLDKELEDEWVWVFVNDCTAWRYVGYGLTSDEGRVTFNFAAALPTGEYDARMEVVGDATSVPLRLFVLPSGTHLAVFDLDGTLTTDDTQLFESILLGTVPAAYPAAADLTWAEATRNEVIVYLTGRPEILAGKSRDWLGSLGFAPGALHLARTANDVLPTNSGVGAYKLAYLRSLQSAGMILDDAFGNATTDVYAYGQAGMRASRTWIIGSNAGAGGTNPVTGSWAAVVARLLGEPAVPQP
jgi:hypothetical protein